jgi:erythromycin esterase-like protein
MAERLFRDRGEAGRVLAGLLERYRGRPDVLVLGLPRGGVPVACEVAAALGAPLDVFLVRKLGVPGHEEVAMGAIASGGTLVLNDDVVRVRGRGDDAAARARRRYACFDHVSGSDGQAYGFAAAFAAADSCEREVVEQLVDLQRHALDYARRHGLPAHDELLYADTLDALAVHLSRQHRGHPAKLVVWAHNSHLGDARATEVAGNGELNVGQLVRERHPGDCRLVGFTTYTGTVTAADDWEGPAERSRVRPALADSVEELFHEAGEKAVPPRFGDAPNAAGALGLPRLQRAIGVIYRPETERQSHV